MNCSIRAQKHTPQNHFLFFFWLIIFMADAREILPLFCRWTESPWRQIRLIFFSLSQTGSELA